MARYSPWAVFWTAAGLAAMTAGVAVLRTHARSVLLSGKPSVHWLGASTPLFLGGLYCPRASVWSPPASAVSPAWPYWTWLVPDFVTADTVAKETVMMRVMTTA